MINITIINSSSKLYTNIIIGTIKGLEGYEYQTMRVNQDYTIFYCIEEYSIDITTCIIKLNNIDTKRLKQLLEYLYDDSKEYYPDLTNGFLHKLLLKIKLTNYVKRS